MEVFFIFLCVFFIELGLIIGFNFKGNSLVCKSFKVYMCMCIFVMVLKVFVFLL